MSIKIFNAVWENGPQTRSQMLVLMVLADAADGETGKCFPSIGRIARLARMSRRTAINTLNALQEDGWFTREPLRRQNGSQSVFEYKLSFEKLGLESGVQKLHGGAKTAPPPMQKLHTTCCAETAGLLNLSDRTLCARERDDFEEWRSLPLNGKPPFREWRIARANFA